MKLMQWNDALATGIITIDNQHKRIVELTNQLGGAIDRNDAEVAEHVLKDLLDYTVYHFSFEEELMEKAGYQALSLHKRVHELFVKRVLGIKKRYDEGEDVLEELHDMLEHWLLSHIQNEDRDYAPSLREYLIQHEQSRAPGGAPQQAAPAPGAAAPHPAAQAPRRSLLQRIASFFMEKW